MRRTRTLGATVCAMLVTSALMASAHALAATPEWYECIKQAGGTYQKFCAAEGGKGGYVVKAGVGSGAFVGHGAKMTIGGPRNPMTCGVTLEGLKQMPNLLSSATLVMSSCHREGQMKQSCELQEEKGGAKEPKFESEPLTGELGYISHSPLKVGLKLTPASGPEGFVFSRVLCVGPPEHFRLRGSFVAEVTGVVNMATKKTRLSYVPGPYQGEGQPAVNPPLEGEEAGGFIEEIHTTGEEFGMPMAAAVSGTQKVGGTQMIKA